MKSLKNYSTEINEDRTILEIEKILSMHGATDIWKQYDSTGNISCLNFAIHTDFGKMPFRLPMDVQKVSQILKNQKRAGGTKGLSRAGSEDLKTARRVGWRIIKDWIDAQMALIEINLVKIEQVFLPYAYNPAKDQTLYESLKERRFAGMLMEAPDARK